MPGCSGGNGTDAGTPDVDNTPVDAGSDAGPPPISLHGVGTRCTDSSQNPPAQSNCDRTLVCVELRGNANSCTKATCATNADCGVTGAFPNGCEVDSATESLCLRGCDPTQATNSLACGRSDFTCQMDQNVGLNVCIPDCRVLTTSCVYPEACSMTDGQCDGSPQCTTAADCTATPTTPICTPDTAAGVANAPSVCTPDCTAAGAANMCPMGFTCDMTAKSCVAVQRSYYDTCAPTDGACDKNAAICIGFTQKAGGQICLDTCTKDSDCPQTPNPSGCIVKLTNGSSVCGIICDPKATTTTCPTGTACVYQGAEPATPTVAVDFCGPM